MKTLIYDTLICWKWLGNTHRQVMWLWCNDWQIASFPYFDWLWQGWNAFINHQICTYITKTACQNWTLCVGQDIVLFGKACYLQHKTLYAQKYFIICMSIHRVCIHYIVSTRETVIGTSLGIMGNIHRNPTLNHKLTDHCPHLTPSAKTSDISIILYTEFLFYVKFETYSYCDKLHLTLIWPCMYCDEIKFIIYWSPFLS